MRFLADECCDVLIVHILRDLGYDVTYVAELMPGLTDDDVLARSVSEERILLTEDHDFGELVFREQKTAYGVVLFRIPPEERQKKADRTASLVQHHEGKLPGALAVVTLNTIRIRPLPKSDEFENEK